MVNNEMWKENVKRLWNAELIFSELKVQKKFDKKTKYKIERKLRELTYSSWVNSPKIKNNPAMKQEVIQECLTDWVSFNSVRERVSDIQSSDSAKSIV